MPVAECLERVSHREFLAWQEWFKEEYNIPSRGDFYMMRLIGAVEHVLSSRNYDINRYRLKFKTDDRKPDADEAWKAQKTAWCGLLGIKR